MTETSMFSLSPSTLKGFKKHKSYVLRQIPVFLSKPRELLLLILTMNMFANILAQNVASNLFSGTEGWIWKVGFPLVLTFLFSELLPKIAAMENNTFLAQKLIYLVLFFNLILGKIKGKLLAIANFVSKYTFYFVRPIEPVPLKMLVTALSTREGKDLVSRDEKELLEGLLALNEVQVKEVMRPRSEILYYSLDEDLKRLELLFSNQACGRVPVCEKDLDQVVGVLTAKDYLTHRERIAEPKDVRNYVRKPFFVPETSSCRQLLEQLYDKGYIMALVVDEYGVLSGLVTREDLVELIVGEIVDQRDEKQRFTRLEDGAVIASGRWELTDFEKEFHISLKSKHGAQTIGGWLCETWGNIPEAGVKMVAHNLLFHILAANPNCIRRVHISHLGKTKPSGERQ